MERENMQEQIERTERARPTNVLAARPFRFDLFITSDWRNSLAIYNGIHGNERAMTNAICFSLAPIYIRLCCWLALELSRLSAAR